MTGKRNWSYDVISIIQHLRLPENVFENFVACDSLNVKHKTFLLIEEEWQRDTSKKPKLRKYITLRENFAIPNYVSTSLPKPHRSIFAQFCCGISPLRVETGRRQSVRDETTGQIRSLKLEERVCSVCSSGEVEYNFLLKCNVCSDIRVDHINNIMRNNTDFINFSLEQKFTFLITKETLNFLCKAWSKRKTCLYL